MRMDAQSDALAGELELDVRNLRLNELLARFDIEIAEIEMEQEGIGAFSGRGKLAVRGNSIAELAGSADGQAAFIMRGGQLNALIVEAIGLDVGEAVALLLTGDEKAQSEMVPIRCFVGEFKVQDGVMRADALVLDTTDSTITGKGQIDLGAETLSLEFVAHPKDASVLTASTPVRIAGTLKGPEVDPVSEALRNKSLAALALGVILPVLGAVFPFIEQGETEDKNCGRLIEDALASVERASPSPTAE
jgi:AsmA family protein